MFDTAKLKHEWAKKHIANLQSAFNTFVQTSRHTIRASSDPDTDNVALQLSFDEPIPPAVPLMIGDIVHNFRSALDHATWELIGLDGGTQNRRLSFPARGTKQDFNSACDGIETPRADTKSFFRGFEAYEQGSGRIIFGLHCLSNVDKHRILTPLLGATRIPGVKVINPDGMVIAEYADCSFTMGEGGRTHFSVGRGCRIELDDETNPTIEAFFGDVEVFRELPIFPMLAEFISIKIAEVIVRFE